jgi:iron(III) transport system substrate-binding protein
MRSGGLVLTAAVALTIAGCQRPPADNGEEPTDSNSVTVVCGATQEWCEAMTAGFTEETGIEANFVRLSSGEALARITAGKDNPEFDVWHGGPADGYANAYSQGLLEAYVSPNAAQIDERHKDADGGWTGVYVGALGFCNNTKVIAEKGADVPESWEDLLQPELAQNIAMAHPGTSGTAYTGLWTQIARNDGDVERPRSTWSAFTPTSCSTRRPEPRRARWRLVVRSRPASSSLTTVSRCRTRASPTWR